MLELLRQDESGGCCRKLLTRHADSRRAFPSAFLPGEASAVKVESQGHPGANNLDGASEPYNPGARHAAFFILRMVLV